MCAKINQHTHSDIQLHYQSTTFIEHKTVFYTHISLVVFHILSYKNSVHIIIYCVNIPYQYLPPSKKITHILPIRSVSAGFLFSCRCAHEQNPPPPSCSLGLLQALKIFALIQLSKFIHMIL